MGKYLDVARKLAAETRKTRDEWLAAWRELARVIYGITTEDPRFEPVMRWLNVCDVAFHLDAWSAFQDAADRVKSIAGEKQNNRPPCCTETFGGFGNGPLASFVRRTYRESGRATGSEVSLFCRTKKSRIPFRYPIP